MSVIVPSYAYTYIKTGFLKKLIMDSEALERIKSINDIHELINFIEPYYPDLSIKNYEIEEIEKKIYNIHIKLIGRLISSSPNNIRNFLRDFLLKYEIMNIRQIIIGSILGMNIEEKRNNINPIVHEYLDNTEFIENLIKITNIEEIQLYLKNTKYNYPVREGLLYFRSTNEVFVLESFLDQLYFINFKKSRKALNKIENAMISLYTKYQTEIYNINLIYRGILNNIDRYLLSQFIVKNSLFLNYDMMQSLIRQKELDSFFKLLNRFLRKSIEIRTIGINFNSEMDYPIWELEKIYQKIFFNKFKLEVGNIDYSTIYRIFELLVKKEKEIKLIIIPNMIRIIHDKYKMLE
ncbi:MAG: V-type ATPase subunit [Candidatus Lokiarchaeota archaeon]|nr:V-type ATPase subunit [Candidatus Lokiarchaeota archaeon]